MKRYRSSWMPIAAIIALLVAATACSDDSGSSAPDAKVPLDTSPADTSPVDTSPVDTSPVDTSPLDARDTQPSEDLPSITGFTLRSVALSGGKVMLGLSNGHLLRQGSTHWVCEVTNLGQPVLSIAASSLGTFMGVGEAYSVGAQQGGLYQWDTTGTPQAKLFARITDHNQRNASVRRVLANDTHVWAFGDKGAFYRFAGVVPTKILPIEGLGYVASDASLAGQRVWVTAMGKLWRSDATGMLQDVFETSGSWGAGYDIRRVAAIADDDVYIVAVDATATPPERFIAHFDGSAWAKATTPNIDARALFARSANDVFAGGTGGKLLHFDGTTWTAVATNISEDIMELSAGPGGTLLLLAEDVLYQYDGQTITKLFRVGDPFGCG